ncbi:MAG: hypothetical protein F6K18_11810 [Okeania sp. SIO2C2]|uniref:hypothetical protein n=1 Tax=Okeania sp. SIO2C2 TaxID=2607787 RepID=UPI0013BABD9B|nr:hypothetical protein [Okeania sp. SIO2C2]NEP87456.1 hypothetical protein [Okeania sp. SIO2C2]
MNNTRRDGCLLQILVLKGTGNEEGRQKAEGRRQKEKKGLKGEGFFITNYPDMILYQFSAKLC